MRKACRASVSIFCTALLVNASSAAAPPQPGQAGPTTIKLRSTIEEHDIDVNAVAFIPDGKMLASCSCDNTVMLWDVKTGRERATLEGHTHSVSSVAFSPDCKTLASCDFDNAILLWDVMTGK